MAKIGYISDTHLDFYAESKVRKIQKHADKLIHEGIRLCHIAPDSDKYYDAIIVAGDIGHYNKDNIVFLNRLKKYADNIICVLGNHDHWLVSKSQVKKYKSSSQNRVDEFTKMCKDNDIQLLDPGHTFIRCKDNKVISILGFNGWYDGNYHKANKVFMNIDWAKYMNDSRSIYPSPKNFDDMHKSDMSKLDTLLNFRGDDLQPDIIVSHVRPTINARNIEPQYRTDKATPFYCFDGSVLMQRLKPKYWVFGHTHDGEDFVENGVNVITNAYGYPGESGKQIVKIKEIEL